MKKLGYNVPLIASWTASMSNFIDAAAANGNGVQMPQTFIQEGASRPQAKAFIDAYKKKYNTDRIPSAVSAAQGYDSMHLLANAIAQAGSTEGPKVKAALENLSAPYEGAIATFEKPYSATDHEAIHKQQVVMGVVQSGKVVAPSGAGAAAAASTPAPASTTPAPAKP
jgi:branched-chain amino acid transport system substrate-binding protein